MKVWINVGDLVFVTKDNIMMSGVQRNLPITIDIDDKVTALDVEYTLDNIIDCTLMSLDSRIGEISNVATCYLNKQTKNEEQIEKYNNFVCLLSVINGKEIDYAKTGMRWNIPYRIAKFARPLPYFMKYAGKYYSTLKHFAKTRCNLNYLCWDIEKWQKKIRFQWKAPNTAHLMIDYNIQFDEESYAKIEELYVKFNKEIKEYQIQNNIFDKNFDLYEDLFSDLSKQEILHTTINWEAIYDKYRKTASAIVKHPCELANYAIDICYNKHPNKSKNFAWIIAEEGLLLNLEKNKELNIKLPFKSDDGEDYLGQKYKMRSLFE